MLNTSLTHRNGLAAATQELKHADMPTDKSTLINSPASEQRLKSAKYLNRRGPSFQWWLMAIPAFMTSTYALLFLTTDMNLFDPAVKAKIASTIDGVAHISASLVALGVGPFQFLPIFQQKYPAIHRAMGWGYFAAISIGATAALVVTYRDMPYTRQWGRLGCFVESLLWLETLRRSFVAISRHHDVKAHRRWMMRNYAITYGAVTLRWELPFLLKLNYLSLSAGIALSAWISWVPQFIAGCEVFTLLEDDDYRLTLELPLGQDDIKFYTDGDPEISNLNFHVGQILVVDNYEGRRLGVEDSEEIERDGKEPPVKSLTALSDAANMEADAILPGPNHGWLIHRQDCLLALEYI
ncbi:hypothetical protein DHEL01_v211495 [Diaporthe helianthi]|uniref:Uncharacterized protein n=1 Tax=Diaporthe helianthi TaxID=158607 RepID=A0A2P5HIN8_DIAHE|nr:hypothetical protein DHEL01_v211495 [Diaporthe helianthi]